MRRGAPRPADLVLVEVVLVEQQPDLEGDLVVELGDRDRGGRGGLEPLGLRLTEAAVSRAGVGVARACSSAASGRPPRWARPAGPPARCDRPGRRRARPARGSPAPTSRMRRWQTRACSVTSVIAKRDGLAQLDTVERVVGVGVVLLGHEREAPRIGRVGLRPAHPALGKVLRPERVDHRHRHRTTLQVGSEAHPVVADSTPS